MQDHASSTVPLFCLFAFLKPVLRVFNEILQIKDKEEKDYNRQKIVTR